MKQMHHWRGWEGGRLEIDTLDVSGVQFQLVRLLILVTHPVPHVIFADKQLFQEKVHLYLGTMHVTFRSAAASSQPKAERRISGVQPNEPRSPRPLT